MYSSAGSPHARLLKDYHLYRADIYSQTLSLPNTLLRFSPMERGCMEIGLYPHYLDRILVPNGYFYAEIVHIGSIS